MDGPPRAGSTARALQAQGLDTERTSAIPRRAGVGDPGRGHPGKPVGAVVAAAKVLRVLHASERSLNASEVARRSEEHTSELQSPCNLVCRLLLEKKKKTASAKARRTPPWSHATATCTI